VDTEAIGSLLQGFYPDRASAARARAVAATLGQPSIPSRAILKPRDNPFKGKVRILLDPIAAGQMQPSGTLQDFGAPAADSRGIAVIDIVDDISDYQIPAGAAAEVAIYTDHCEHVSLIRKILLRMRSWENYIFLEGH
jgi:hypothetical protein